MSDNSGKRLFGRIDNELRDRNKTRDELITGNSDLPEKILDELDRLHDK